MKLLNRSAFVVLPRQPFADWTQKLNASGDGLHQHLTLQEQRQEGTVYLIDEVTNEGDFNTALDGQWLKIFQNELSAWDELGDHWPHGLNYNLFLEWFDVSHQIMALDLSKQPLMLATLDEY